MNDRTLAHTLDRANSDVVLIVDDVPDNLSVLHDALDESGYTVLVATHGEAALQRAAQALPDIVLLDAMMPGMDGFEVAKRLKAAIPEAELKARVESIQERTFKLRNRAMDAVVDLIADIEKAQKAGKPEAVLVRARGHQRTAQFKLDFIEAENSMGFHAPQEAARILAESVDEARRGQVVLRDPAYRPTVTKLEK